MKQTSKIKLLEAIQHVNQAQSIESLGEQTPEILDELLGAELCVWNLFDHRKGQLLHNVGNPEFDPTIAKMVDVLNAHYHEHPIVKATGMSLGNPVAKAQRISNHISQAKFEETGLFREAFRKLDSRFQVSAQLLVEGDIEIIVAANRLHCDFDDEELELLDGLKPHFAFACSRQLQSRELNERLNLLTRQPLDERRISLSIDERGRILNETGEALTFLASRFRDLGEGLPPPIQNLLKNLPVSIGARSRSLRVKDDFGMILEFTILTTGFGKRRTLLFGGKPGAFEPIPFHQLTKREQEVLEWIAEGKTNPEIALLLSISNRTVEKHCERIYEKLGVENRIAAAREWILR